MLGTLQLEQICRELNENVFSLCIDESTDVSNTKILSLVVRVCINFEVKDLFFGLIKVQSADASSIYNAIVGYFITHNVNYKNNMIGFAADGANNMTGKHHSVASLFKKDCSNLFVIKCICHSIALCSSYACLKLPSVVETTVRDIYNYIGNSPKRTDHLKDILILLDYKPKICYTRLKLGGYPWKPL